MIEGETYIEEAVESGKKMVVITESKNRDLSPHIQIEGSKKSDTPSGASILPVRATVIVRDGEKVKAGQILVKIPRDVGKTRDITGGLPRIAELFEARNPANPAVITEIDGNIKYGKVKRGIREIIVMGKEKETTYKIPYGKHILVHEGDFVFAGDKLCEGSVSPKDILRIGGSSKVQEFLVNSIQEVYRLQGVVINDKHIETILRQMLKKVEIKSSGDSKYLLGEIVDRIEFDEENEILKKEKKKPALAERILLGITKASLQTNSFISAASFQETTRVLTDAAIKGKVDKLVGLKENVIVGRLIPAGTGYTKTKWQKIANQRDSLLPKQSSEELKEKQFQIT